MKLIAGILIIFLGINLIFPHSALAKFAFKQTRQVPISRLLKNLEAQRGDAKGATDKAMIDFRIGRLHAMAYAQKTEEAPCDANAIPGSRYELPYDGFTQDHAQFKVENGSVSQAAREHLKKAIESMQAALKLDPSLLTAKLGLAWCLEQSGDKKQALSVYRKVFAEAYESEKHSTGGMQGWSITLETALYLQKLLDPAKDRTEINSIKTRVEDIEKLPNYITPIAVPLSPGLRLENMLENSKVSFNLDGFGKREQSRWLSKRAAWLVHDPSGSGDIDSGLKLIGQSSFWIFWKNGYEVLKSLDDNRDGELRAEELKDLALWHDANSNGLSERGEVKALCEYGITALKTGCSKSSSNVLWNESGVLFKNGERRASYDLILPGVLDKNNWAKQVSRPASPRIMPPRRTSPTY